MKVPAAMDELVNLEHRVQEVYDKTLLPLARRLEYDLSVSGKDAAGLPNVLFLGNHSSGKSSFINFLLETDIQKTGLAPTDDGFTIITFGDKPDEFDGQTVVTHPDLAFKHLQRLGPAFVSRMRMKTLPKDLLQSLTLIDSPGMIDAAGTANSRGYDFSAGVRYFAEAADLILFFFDPDKPGTTGETVSIFTETLAGLEHKLLIIMNKVDLFPNIRDFARTYGTLCWNLSKTIKTKDIPHIFNTYLPIGIRGETGSGKELVGSTTGARIPLKDFDASRDEVVAEIKRAPTRRADNLVSDLLVQARRLSMHARICHEMADRFKRLRSYYRGWALLFGLLTGLGVWATWKAESWTTPALVAVAGAALAGASWGVGRWNLIRKQRAVMNPQILDAYFAKAYRRELAVHDRADLRAMWEIVRDKVLDTLKIIGPNQLAHNFSSRRQLRRLEEVMEEEVPGLRRDIAEYHRSRRRSATNKPAGE